MKYFNVRLTSCFNFILCTALFLLLASHPPLHAQTLKFGLTPVYGKPMSPDLDLRSLDGKRYTLSDYLGRTIVVNFWATWCPPCIEEMPALQKLWDRLHAGKAEIFAVNMGEREETIQAFLDRFEPKLRFPILIAPDQSIMDKWKIQALPTSYIIDPRGRLVFQAVGPRDFDHEHIIEKLRSLMDENSEVNE